MQAALKAPVNRIAAREAAAEAVPNQGPSRKPEVLQQKHGCKQQNAVKQALPPVAVHQLVEARRSGVGLHGLKLNLSRLSRSLGMGKIGQDRLLPSFDRLNASHDSGMLKTKTDTCAGYAYICVKMLANCFE